MTGGAPAFDRIVEAIRSNGHEVKITHAGSRARAQCPAHGGDDLNLSIHSTKTRVDVTCHSHGCDGADILEAVGLCVRDKYHDPAGPTYRYDNGLDVHRLISRPGAKGFSQTGNKASPKVLYRLEEVGAAVTAGEVIYLVEGEEDVHALETLGAGNFAHVDTAPLTGSVVVAVVDQDEAGKHWAKTVAEKVGPVAASLEFVAPKTGKDSSDHIVAEYGLDDFVPTGAEADGDDAPALPRVWSAGELVGIEQPKWLARGRLPRSAVTLLVGDEGIGKSLLWVWIVAAITTGQALPEFGLPTRSPGEVLLVLTEDEWSSTVLPRLEIAGADLKQVKVICTERDGSGSPVFPRDMHLVREARATLVVVDAFADTVAPNISLKDPQQARRALHPWKEAATVTGAAILLLTHTNRVESRSARDRYGLTGELRKKARMTLFAQLDEDGETLVVGPEKSNIAAKIAASKFTIDPVHHFAATEDHDGTVPKLRWIGEHDKTARELIEDNYDAGHGAGDAEDRTEAEQWLEDYLTSPAVGGEAPSKDVKAAAKREGITERTLKRAAKKLGIEQVSAGFPRTTVWRFPTTPASATSGASQATPDTYVSDRGPTGPTAPDKEERRGPTGQSGQSGQSGHGETHGPTAVPSPDGTPEEDVRRCIECHEPIESGRVRHPHCYAAATRRDAA